MPALLEWQRAFSAQLLQPSPPDPASGRVDIHAARLAIYRNTAVSVLVNALRLSYPAVKSLVGNDFFEAAARAFIGQRLPGSGCLNDYGGDFAAFLADFPAARSVAYLCDVARLEWAVNNALHAPDAASLDLTRLAALEEAATYALRFRPHPGLTLLQLRFPADLVWRAVLEQDQAAMASIDVATAALFLLVERDAQGVQVHRLSAAQGTFTANLLAGSTLAQCLSESPDPALPQLLAEHLASGRLIDFYWQDSNPLAPPAGEPRV